MNIKRFAAKDMRAALRQVRAMLGPDAVILSSRQAESGVEVVAAVDFDERVLAATATPPAEGFERGEDASPGPERSSDVHDYERIAQRVQAAAAARAERAESSVGEEIKELRRLLETQLACLAWNDLNRRKPIRARVLRQLAKLGIDADLARELADCLPSAQPGRDVWRLPLQLLAERIPVARRELADAGRVFAVVGPTGVGKTTSIAKIAARFVLRGRAQDLGIVSTDNYRIGAREQLLTFARILGVPLHVAQDAYELRDVLQALASKKLVLIDTAGMSQRDVRLAQQFSILKVAGDIHPVLTVSAATDRSTLGEISAAFDGVRPKALIVTKVDEAASLGPVLSLAIRSKLPIAYVSDGQRVPEDIHLAGGKRLWLMQTAMKLAREGAQAQDEDELAYTFGNMELAANG